MYLGDVHAHLLHNLHAIAETKHDTFLGSTHEMRLVVLKEVDAMHRTTYFFVHQHTLGTVAKRYDRESVAANGHLSGQIVHGSIPYALGSYIATHPGIEDPRTIDAEEHTETSLLIAVIDMSKCVDTTLGIILHLSEHTINDTRSTCRRGYFTRIEHIETQRIVGLITGTVGDGSTGSETSLSGSSYRHLTLTTERGKDGGNDVTIETIVVHQERCHLLLLEVPEHPFTQSAHRSAGRTTEFHR